jgi:hypothetical protein
MNPNSKDPRERRRHARVKFQEPVTVHGVVESKSGNVFEVQGNPINVVARNVSEGGICLKIGDVSAPAKIFKLNFEIQKDKPVDVYSRLVWFTNGDCGLQFVVVDDKIRQIIRNYIEKSL